MSKSTSGNAATATGLSIGYDSGKFLTNNGSSLSWAAAGGATTYNSSNGDFFSSHSEVRPGTSRQYCVVIGQYSRAPGDNNVAIGKYAGHAEYGVFGHRNNAVMIGHNAADRAMVIIQLQ